MRFRTAYLNCAGSSQFRKRQRLVDRWRQHQRLARTELFADQRQAENAALEAIGETREERSFLLVLEEIELADDEVALLAGLDEFAEQGMRAAGGEIRRHDLGIHAGDKKSVDAYVRGECALGIER